MVSQLRELTRRRCVLLPNFFEPLLHNAKSRNQQVLTEHSCVHLTLLYCPSLVERIPVALLDVVRGPRDLMALTDSRSGSDGTFIHHYLLLLDTRQQSVTKLIITSAAGWRG